MINMKVNGIEITAPAGSTILEAVRLAEVAMPYAEINIPTLYQLKNVQESDKSGVCVVEVIGKEGLIPAWEALVEEGMQVLTESEAVVLARKTVLQNILKIHDHDCVNCPRTDNCELQNLLFRYSIDDQNERKYKMYPIDESAIIVRDSNKCIRCHRCVSVCTNIQSVSVIAAEGEGIDSIVAPICTDGLSATKCVNCGQCISVCPVGALYEKSHTEEVLEALEDPNKYVIAQTAPSVRAALGEEFGFPLGVDVEGRLAAALRQLGFDRVFDTQFGADLTIVEEANEFLERVTNGRSLPLMTSCCPGWVKFCEHEFPDLLENLSSCKSPHQMMGAITKTYVADQLGIPKENLVVVSIMPCTAKKFEIHREYESGAGVVDVDISITTRELANMLKQGRIQFEAMPMECFDEPLGESTGAAVIFGATGGVMEAALRTAAEKISGQVLDEIDFIQVRGVDGIKEATVKISDKEFKVAVVSGLANARVLLEKVRAKEAIYDFIEVMACPGGCVNGGGQPIQVAQVRAVNDIRQIRAMALYENDIQCTVRKSHDNPAIIKLYKEYLDTPGSAFAHKLLHTKYIDRSELY